MPNLARYFLNICSEFAYAEFKFISQIYQTNLISVSYSIFYSLKSTFSPSVKIQIYLLKLATLFLAIYALALTLSPAARARSWEVELRWSHWLGFAIWLVSIVLILAQTNKYAPDADPYLIPISALLTGWGVLSIWRLDAGFGFRQALWVVFCAVVYSLAIKFPQNLNILHRYKYIFLFSGLILTALTLILGTNPGGNGPRLWLGCCGLYLQPSEPLKLLLIVYLAAFFSDRIPILSGLLPLIIPSLFLTGIAIAILITQRDLGTAGIFIFLYASMVYMASGKRRLLLISILLLILVGLVGYFFVDIIRFRITTWLDPWTDPSGRSYQVIQSILAVANGGIYGRGPGMGSPGLVPVAHSDFIYTSIAEETGMVGSIVLLALFALIAARGFLIAIRAGSQFRRLLAAGITTYFCGQSILIIGGNLRVLPLTGVTLPFLSYGGSSLLTSFIGILFLIQISNEVEQEPAYLNSQKPYLLMAGFIGAGLIACAAATGWWADVRADDLLSRTDNPRRAIADQFVLRGALLDRQNRAINISKGEPGSYTRSYLVPALGPITGYTHPVYGQAGLEASLDPYLRGLQGNPTLLIWWDYVLYGQPPVGLNFRLSLDLDVQKQADELLGAHRGAIVVINANTGEILAMVSHPTFDPNSLDTNGETLPYEPNAPLLNRASQGSYPVQTILAPLLSVAFEDAKPADSELVNFYDKLGFYKTPQLRLPVASAAVKGTLKDLNVSPIQMISAIAGLSNQGLCPGLQIASAVEIPAQGWVVMPEPEKPVQCLPVNNIKQELGTLQVQGKPFWEYTSSGMEKNQPITSYESGTLPNWSGTPLAVVVILEENNPVFAKLIGSSVMQKAIQP